MMSGNRAKLRFFFGVALCATTTAVLSLPFTAHGQNVPAAQRSVDDVDDGREAQFAVQLQPFLQTYCVRCHNQEEMKSGVRLDDLTGYLNDDDIPLWQNIRRQVDEHLMPPEEERQPKADHRNAVSAWIDQAVAAARSRPAEFNGSVRRLTTSEYRNTLRDLLGIEEELTGVLPPDGITREGFANSGEDSALSPLHIEAYFNIAEKALDLSLVDVTAAPVIQNLRVELGTSINQTPCPDKLILGANSHLLQNQDFQVTELTPSRSFSFQPFRMQTVYDFIEGYKGNSTVRGWRKFDSIYHSVFACMRGNEGYPKGDAYNMVPEGLLLRPAIPSAELFQVESTYGPRANFKISLRELPDHGNFQVRVIAARYEDALLLDPAVAPQPESSPHAVTVTSPASAQTVNIEQAGIYQADAYPASATEETPAEDDAPGHLTLNLGQRQFSGTLSQPAFLAVRLPAGPLNIEAKYAGSRPLARLHLTRLPDSHDLAEAFRAFEKRTPRIGVHMGLRRDCGSTLNPVGPPRTVVASEYSEFVFQGAINNFPSPDVEKNNVNYLAGIREIGVRSEFTDGRDMPRLLIRSVEFEGPYYEDWPPVTHQNILIESNHPKDSEAYAREVIVSFATRAFRRPLTEAEAESLVAVWSESFQRSGHFVDSLKDALQVVLTSPQFLFLTARSESPEPEDLDSYELASRLSYFLWNTLPDEALLRHASTNTLHTALDSELDRMLSDPRSERFVREFTEQWLGLSRFDVVNVDRDRFPKLTREVKKHLREEPIRFVQYLIEHNLPLHYLIQSDFVMANEVVADYYGLSGGVESGFEFFCVPHHDPHLGGLLTQASILAGLSDGHESNPVKRGAWFARRIIAEPPDDPPPNVPALPPDDGSHLTLRQKLERHRDQAGCANCHAGIDPWGIPFETFDAGGLRKQDANVDARSTLPDATDVADLNELKDYLAQQRIDQVAFSFLKHLSCYAVGRSLTYKELVFLEEQGIQLQADKYCMHDLIRFVVHSDLFRKK